MCITCKEVELPVCVGAGCCHVQLKCEAVLVGTAQHSSARTSLLTPWISILRLEKEVEESNSYVAYMMPIDQDPDYEAGKKSAGKNLRNPDYEAEKNSRN